MKLRARTLDCVQFVTRTKHTQWQSEKCLQRLLFVFGGAHHFRGSERSSSRRSRRHRVYARPQSALLTDGISVHYDTERCAANESDFAK